MADSLTVWQQRLTSLLAAIQETAAIAQNVKIDRDVDTYDLQESRLTLPGAEKEQVNDKLYEQFVQTKQVYISRELLNSLHAFTKEAGDDFLNRFFKEEAHHIDKDHAFRHRFILRTLFYQASLDLSIIQRAINQRRNLNGQTSLLGRGLALADRVAALAINPLVTAGYLPDTTNIVCYLDKNVRARLVPYDDTLLISVSFDSLQHLGSHGHLADAKPEILSGGGPARNLIVLLHELGHHLYWDGRSQNKPLRDLLLADLAQLNLAADDWRLRWFEEIFADAYALIQGGPAVVLDFQNMLTDDQPDHFSEDTDKHPVPELRPYIQTQLLRLLKRSDGSPLYTNLPDKLDANWGTLIVDNALTKTYDVRTATQTGSQLLKELEPVLNIILSRLAPLLKEAQPWSSDAIKGNNLNDLYHQFADVARPQADDLFVAYFMGEIEDEATNAYYDKRFSTTPKTFAQRVKELTGKAPSDATDEKWIEKFLAEGWSTEGPDAGIGGH